MIKRSHIIRAANKLIIEYSYCSKYNIFNFFRSNIFRKMLIRSVTFDMTNFKKG